MRKKLDSKVSSIDKHFIIVIFPRINGKYLFIITLRCESRFFSRSSSIHKYNARSSAMGNYYVNESPLGLKLNSFVNFGTRLWNYLHPDWRALTKRPFKKQIRKFLFTVLEAENACVDVYCVITKWIIIINTSVNFILDQLLYSLFAIIL